MRKLAEISRKEIREEIELFIKEKEEKEEIEKTKGLEEYLKRVAIMVAGVILFLEMLFVFIAWVPISAFVVFLPIYIFLNGLSFFIVKSKLNPEVKQHLLLMIAFINLMNLNIPLILN